MATIQLILNAIDRASAPLKNIAANAQLAADRVDALNSKLDASTGAATANTGALNRLADSLDGITARATAAAAAQSANAGATAASGAAALAARYGWGALFGTVTLFAGTSMAHAVSGLHLAVDLVAEFGAVAIPASIALGVFGVAASDAVNNVVRHFTDLHTVADATGQSIWPLSGALEALHKAVQPQVYEILGDALLVANTRMGEFRQLAMGTGTVLDQLAARATAALESSGMSQFMRNAIPDLDKFGQMIGNIFGIIGNLLKTMPGYAEVILSALDGITHALETITANGVVQGLIGLGLSMHGLWLYAGLAVSGVMLLQGPLTRLATWAVTAVYPLISLGIAMVSAAASGTVLDGAMVLLDALTPWGWVAIGVAALAGLVFWVSRTKDATMAWTATVNASIAAQTTWTGLTETLGQAQQMASQKLITAQKQLGQAVQETGGITEGAATKFAGTSVQVQMQAQQVTELTAAQKQWNAQQQTARSRLDDLSKAVGGTSLAFGLMAQANIKVSDLATKSASGWAADKTQILGLQEGLRAMADYAAGNATTALQVLDQQATDQYAAVQKVNSAWDTFTQNMTGTQSSFDTAAQGYSTLADASTSFTLHLGVLSQSVTGTKAAIDSLSQNGIALNQAFTEQVSNVAKLYDSWRTAGIASNLFTQGVQASIAPLLKYAAGSQEATDQLVGLAEQAGYQGPATLKSLTQWLGSTGNATATLKSITNQATQQEALLTGAMSAQGAVISNQLIGDINQAILKYNGVQQAASRYGQTLAQYGAQSSQARSALDALNQKIIASGVAAGDSAGQIAAMIAKVDKIPLKVAMQIVMTGAGSFSIAEQVVASGGNPVAAIHVQPMGHAAGGYIRGPGGPSSDRIPALLSNGEYVMRASAVAKYGRHMMDAVNAQRFASGGLVLAGNRRVLSGQYALDVANTFAGRMAGTMESAMRGYASGGLVTDDPFLANRTLGSLSPGTPLDLAPATTGPLFTINGDLVVNDEADATLIAQRLSGMIRMASLGGGVRL